MWDCIDLKSLYLDHRHTRQPPVSLSVYESSGLTHCRLPGPSDSVPQSLWHGHAHACPWRLEFYELLPPLLGACPGPSPVSCGQWNDLDRIHYVDREPVYYFATLKDCLVHNVVGADSLPGLGGTDVVERSQYLHLHTRAAYFDLWSQVMLD